LSGKARPIYKVAAENLKVISVQALKKHPGGLSFKEAFKMELPAHTIWTYSYDTTLCPITLTANETALEGLNFGGAIKETVKTKDSMVIHEENEIIKSVYRQFKEYLEAKRHLFDIPLFLYGTEFQMKVWAALRNIPWGETTTYKAIATESGNEKASRAAGGAIHNNPVAVIIPCHRVLGSDGSLTGFAAGLNIKRALLKIEGRMNLK
jgi:methylated-DNA-[protein]-cysteine S-methyltransferase